MPRFKNVNGKDVQLTAQEEAERDAEEAAWNARVIVPPTPTLADVIAILSADQKAALATKVGSTSPVQGLADPAP